jgi:hypothetical protein
MKTLKAILNKYPTANKDAGISINLVNLEEWWISDNLTENTVKCCQMCSISEDIARASFRNISTATN